MSCLRSKRWFLFAFNFLVASVAILVLLALPRWNGNHGIAVSMPVLVSATNANGVSQTLSFAITNLGSRHLEFQIEWLECLAKADRTLLKAILEPLPSVTLAGGTATSLTNSLARGIAASGEYLFCCRINWVENDPINPVVVRLGNWFYSWISKSGDILWPQWAPPWQRPRSLPHGRVYVSNLEVAEYFRVAHGFTFSTWQQESTNVRVRHQGYSPVSMSPQNYQGLKTTTSAEDREWRAKAEFSSFCLLRGQFLVLITNQASVKK